MPLVFLFFLLEVVLLISYGSVQEYDQVILFCNGSLQMGECSLCVLLLALGLIVQFLKFLLQAEIVLAEMQHFLVVLSLHGDDLVLIGFDDLFEFFNDSPMVSLLALPFHLFIIILVLLYIGPQLIDFIIQVLKLLACLYLDNLQQFFLLVYLFGMFLEFFFFLLDALL